MLFGSWQQVGISEGLQGFAELGFCARGGREVLVPAPAHCSSFGAWFNPVFPTGLEMLQGEVVGGRRAGLVPSVPYTGLRCSFCPSDVLYVHPPHPLCLPVCSLCDVEAHFGSLRLHFWGSWSRFLVLPSPHRICTSSGLPELFPFPLGDAKATSLASPGL